MPLLLVQLFNPGIALIVRHLITTAAAIWHPEPIFCARSGPINSIRLFEYAPCHESHANDCDVPKHVVRDGHWLADVKTKCQTPETEQ